MSQKIKGRLPSIPEYYREHINRNVDLISEPKQCCPFHKEDTPSFSYSADKGVWRCFGGCHVGGDIIDLHRVNFKFASRDEAKRSLEEMYEIAKVKTLVVDSMQGMVNETKVSDNIAYVTALQMANSVERWIQLDQVMSEYPVDMYKLRDLVEAWKSGGM